MTANAGLPSSGGNELRILFSLALVDFSILESYVVEAGLEPLYSTSPPCWDYRCTQSCLPTYFQSKPISLG